MVDFVLRDIFVKNFLPVSIQHVFLFQFTCYLCNQEFCGLGTGQTFCVHDTLHGETLYRVSTHVHLQPDPWLEACAQTRVKRAQACAVSGGKCA
jgi:hypothetical protein